MPFSQSVTGLCNKLPKLGVGGLVAQLKLANLNFM